jgi:hypothetical protein
MNRGKDVLLKHRVSPHRPGAGVIKELRTDHRDVLQLCRSSTLHGRRSESLFDSSGHVIAQFLRSLQRPLILTISISRDAICPAGSL